MWLGVLLPFLERPECACRAGLPFRTFLNSSLVEPYWPDESKKMSWVCDECFRCTAFRSEQIVWKHHPLPQEQRPDRGFWRVEVPCEDPSCVNGIAAHTRTYGRTTRGALGRAIAGAHPVPTCSEGHEPARYPYPRRLDFIEWTGAQEYLV